MIKQILKKKKEIMLISYYDMKMHGRCNKYDSLHIPLQSFGQWCKHANWNNCLITHWKDNLKVSLFFYGEQKAPYISQIDVWKQYFR